MRDIKKIDPAVAVLMTDEDFRRLMVDRYNKLLDELRTGVVHETKVRAARAIDGVYDSLPLSVVAEMIEEEAAAAAELLSMNETEI